MCAAQRIQHPRCHVGEIDRTAVQHDLARCHPRYVEQFVDEPRQLTHLSANDRLRMSRLALQGGGVIHDLEGHGDR